MKRPGSIICALIALAMLAAIVLSAGCTSENTPDFKVASTTSLIASIVEKVGGDKVDAANIIPPAQCPGHFDVKTSDIRTIADADLFLMHGWQGEIFSNDLIASADNPELKVVQLNIQGNWMVPAVQAQAVSNITAALVAHDPENADYYQSNAASELAAITAKGNELKAKLANGNLSQINVICDAQQADFVRWAGFNVTATYPRPEDISAKQMQELIDQGRQAGVGIVIGNLQSGTTDASSTIASGIIGAGQVTLSNFPGGFDNTETWGEAVEKNVDLLLEAVATYRAGSHQ